MEREEFIDNLRIANRSLQHPIASRETGVDLGLIAKLHSADLWLTSKSVDGFESADLSDLSQRDRQQLEKEVVAFRAIAREVPPDKPATKKQSRQARKHLEKIIEVVGKHLLQHWLSAQTDMMQEAASAAKAKGWYVQEDKKELHENLLGSYKAPRLVIRPSEDQGAVLSPVAYFGGGRQGVVDLAIMPSYEIACLVTFRDGKWYIVSQEKGKKSRPFSAKTLVNTITSLPHY
jgi:hypothetical protein